MMTNEKMIKHLLDIGALRSERIKQALLAFPREEFVPAEEFHRAYEDHPLLIGQGQTISQPRTVVFMLEELGAQEHDNVLDIGAGSGWQSALLSYLVGNRGHVWAYEILEQEVGKFGKANLEKFNLENVDYFIGDASEHWTEHAPYNRIISGAAFDNIPEELKDLLEIGGCLVTPTQDHNMVCISRTAEEGEKEFIVKNTFGFEFVPFI